MTVRFSTWLAIMFFGIIVAAQTTRTPTPAPGVTHVIVDGLPIVAARQEGQWVQSSTRSSPATVGRRYVFTWPDGERDVHLVSGLRADGWIQVDNTTRWLNTGMALSIEDAH